MTKSKKVSDL
jgi:hypothetical protein